MNYIWISFLFNLAFGYEAITTAAECSTCMANTGFVCKDNSIDFRSYCCDAGEENLLGCQRDQCSGSAQTTSMLSAFCPYQYKVCGLGSSRVRISLLNQWSTINYVSSRFTNTSICFFELEGDPNAFNLENEGYQIQLKVNYFQYTYIYFNEG